MRKVNLRLEVNLWLANHEVNLHLEQPALNKFVVASVVILYGYLTFNKMPEGFFAGWNFEIFSSTTNV